MATRAGVGFSNDADAAVAAAAAVADARNRIGGAPDLCLVFSGAGYDPARLLASLAEAAPGARLVGCSAEGVIAGGASTETEHSVAVLAVRSDTLAFETFLVRDYAADPARAGTALGERVRAVARGDEFALLVFPDGLVGNCGALLGALDASLPPGIRVAGGAAGDGLTFSRTWQFEGRDAVSDAVAAVLVRGPGRLELAVSHGCRPIGLERHVTRAADGWIREIDGQPAWQLFREYLDGDPEDLNTEGIIHLSVGEPLPESLTGEYEPFLIRSPMGLDKASGALFFPGGGVPEHAAIRLTRRDPDGVRDSARRCAANIAARSAGAEPAMVLQFDCAGRGRQMFGSHAAEMIVRPLQEALGGGSAWIGFHTYGEIAPIGGRTFYHNFTVALCAIYDTTDGR